MLDNTMQLNYTLKSVIRLFGDANMPSRASISYIDHSRERSSVSVEGIDITAANFDAQDAMVTALENAIAAVTLGNRVQTLHGNLDLGTKDPPADPEAGREEKWLVSYIDDTNPTRVLTCELPCPDITDSTLRAANSDDWDPDDAGGKWAAFVTAFENFVRAPFTGSAVTVQKVTRVGRRL